VGQLQTVPGVSKPLRRSIAQRAVSRVGSFARAISDGSCTSCRSLAVDSAIRASSSGGDIILGTNTGRFRITSGNANTIRASYVIACACHADHSALA